MIDAVPLPVALALRVLGYVQDGWPQLVWTDAHHAPFPFDDGDDAELFFGLTYLTEEQLNGHDFQYELSRGYRYIAAPSALQALTFLEERYGVRVFYESDARLGGYKWSATEKPKLAEEGIDVPWTEWMHADTPLALLEAVTARLLEEEG